MDQYEERLDEALDSTRRAWIDGQGPGDLPVFEVEQDSAQQWRWHLKAANGEVVAQGEGHGREEDAWRAVCDVRRLAVLAAIPGGES